MINKNKFNLSSITKSTYKIGDLCPTKVMELLPGDVVRGSIDSFSRVTPLNAPGFVKLEKVTETFFVPDRQVWDDADEFHSGGAYGSTPPVYPTMDLYTLYGGSGIVAGSLANRMGLPVTTGSGKSTVSALPFRKFVHIYNTYFWNDNLQSGKPVLSTASGADSTTSVANLTVFAKPDYFMRMSPRQKKTSSLLLEIERLTNAPKWRAHLENTDTASGNAAIGSDASGYVNNGSDEISFDPRGGLVLNTSEIRDSLQLLKYFENAQRLGSDKYSDYAAKFFGVPKQDLRLDEPIRLSKAVDIFRFTEVLQAAPNVDATSDEGVAAMKGHGISGSKGKGFKFFCMEHGHLMTVEYVRPVETAYHGGIPKMWLKTLKADHFQPDLAHMSQQPVQNRELKSDHASPTGTIGYVDIYDEYRSERNNTSGAFDATLNYWHADRKFSSDPAFNAGLLQVPDTTRLFQDASSDHIYTLGFHNIKALRVVPKHGMPTV